MSILNANNLTKVYGSGENAVHALDGISLSVEKGEFVSIVGTSGSGKSTLLHMLGGLDRPTGGTVTIDGKDIFSLKEEALTIFRRRKIGFVFQAYNLVPVLNVYENIVLPIELDGGRADRDFIQKIVHTLGLEERLDALPNQLSGGQQQRVAIARALAAAPAIILADEPTGNLDSNTSVEVMNLMKRVVREKNQTLVMVTHDNYLASFADIILRIRDGKIIEIEDHRGEARDTQTIPEKKDGEPVKAEIRTAGEESGSTASQAQEKKSGKTEAQTPEKESGKTEAQTPDRESGKTEAQTPEKESGKAETQAPDRESGKAEAQTPDKEEKKERAKENEEG